MFATSARLLSLSAATMLLAVSSTHVLAQKKYDTGASDTEIKLGNIVPYSGPARPTARWAARRQGLFQDDQRSGRHQRPQDQLHYARTDAYSPPKAVEQTRKLVEADEVLFIVFGGSARRPILAIQKYRNAKRVPQLFLATGATKCNDPKNFPGPWATPSYQSEGRIYAKYLLKEKAGAKIGVLYQNDDFGKDYLNELKDGLGDKASSIVIEESCELTEPTVDSASSG